MRTRALSAQLLFGRRSRRGASRAGMTHHGHNDAAPTSGMFPTKTPRNKRNGNTGAKEGFGGFGAFEATGTLERQYKAMALGSVPLPPGLGVPVLPKPGLNANKIKGPDNPTCQLLPTSSKRKVKIAWGKQEREKRW